AVLAARGRRFDPALPYPEINYAPLYSLVIAAALAVLPDTLYARPSAAQAGFGADYVLLGLNLLLLWAAAALTYFLGRRLFSARTGAVAALALLFSLPLWQQMRWPRWLRLLLLRARGA